MFHWAPLFGPGPARLLVFEIDRRRRAAGVFIGGLVRGAGSRVVARQPLSVGTWHNGLAASAGICVLLVGRPRIGWPGNRHAQADKTVEVCEVLRAGAIEVDVSVTPPGLRRRDAAD